MAIIIITTINYLNLMWISPALIFGRSLRIKAYKSLSQSPYRLLYQREYNLYLWKNSQLFPVLMNCCQKWRKKLNKIRKIPKMYAYKRDKHKIRMKKLWKRHHPIKKRITLRKELQLQLFQWIKLHMKGKLCSKMTSKIQLNVSHLHNDSNSKEKICLLPYSIMKL